MRKSLGIWFKPNRWFVVAWLLPSALALGTIGISLLMPGVRYSPLLGGLAQLSADGTEPGHVTALREQLPAIQQSFSYPLPTFSVLVLSLFLLVELARGATVDFVPGLGEELGWRGFLLRELSPVGFWKSSFLVGLIWGVWHMPAILWAGRNYPAHPFVGVFLMIISCVLLSPPLSYLRQKSGSVVAAGIFHGSLNAALPAAVYFVEGGNDLTVGLFGLAGVATLAVANVGILVFDRFITGEPILMHRHAVEAVGGKLGPGHRVS